MEGIPVTSLEDLDSHLQQLLEDPDTPLNAKLFDDVELQLTGMCTNFTSMYWLCLWSSCVYDLG
jgi:hypothetical protein